VIGAGAVGRPTTGQLIEGTRKHGRTYAARIRAYGARHYVTLGHSRDGWTRAKAEAELANILADVRRGLWVPEQPEPEPEAPTREPSFHEFASDWFEHTKCELKPNTVAAYEYEITHHLLPFFAEHRLSEITIAEVDRYRHFKVRERDAMRAARERGETRKRRPLSNETINKTLTRLGQILEVAGRVRLPRSQPGSGPQAAAEGGFAGAHLPRPRRSDRGAARGSAAARRRRSSGRRSPAEGDALDARVRRSAAW
jgi:integrase